MRRWIGAGLIGAALGAAGGLAWLAAGDPREAMAEAPKEGWPPDPPPVASNTQWVFEIQSKDSVPSVLKVTQLSLDKAEATPRMMGRFALEFYVGRELLDRLRFNVPLNGDGAKEGSGAGKKRPVFRVNTKFFVRMADQKRTGYLRLVDRATGDVQLFSWPPDKDGKLAPYAADPAAADAGTADAGSDAGSGDAGDAGRFNPAKP